MIMEDLIQYCSIRLFVFRPTPERFDYGQDRLSTLDPRIHYRPTPERFELGGFKSIPSVCVFNIGLHLDDLILEEVIQYPLFVFKM